jgi:hypothetical protein
MKLNIHLATEIFWGGAFCPMGRFVLGAFCPMGRLVLGAFLSLGTFNFGSFFVPWNVLFLELFVPWDVLFWGRFAALLVFVPCYSAAGQPTLLQLQYIYYTVEM